MARASWACATAMPRSSSPGPPGRQGAQQARQPLRQAAQRQFVDDGMGGAYAAAQQLDEVAIQSGVAVQYVQEGRARQQQDVGLLVGPAVAQHPAAVQYRRDAPQAVEFQHRQRELVAVVGKRAGVDGALEDDHHAGGGRAASGQQFAMVQPAPLGDGGERGQRRFGHVPEAGIGAQLRQDRRRVPGGEGGRIGCLAHCLTVMAPPQGRGNVM
ncbi:hypothetical protein WU24_12485 [Bordetella pertussis]|nr:hypothetical protein RD04_08240 [Bordetella pertussis]ANA17394.1 hypothetical protein RD17_11680 [Bordetella pertussis]ANT36152.1 hypothetical protein A7970_03705 [Bordetella pertussis]ANT93272.1 hypothetical protein BBB38_09710 [Bordetella pertussis]AOY20478.1 hypothetical protein BH370_09710 [Bordetella pertussis]